MTNDRFTAFSNPSEETRLEAVTELARNPDQSALQHLQRVVSSDPSPRVRYYARLALSRVSEAKSSGGGRKIGTTEFATLSLDMKLAVIESVARNPGSCSASFLEEVILRESLPFVRLKALESLGLCSDRPEIGFISPFLTVKDPRTVRHAVTALRYLGDMNGLLCLPGISCFDVNFVEHEVERFLGDFSGRELAAFLIRRARRGGPASRHAVLRFIDVFFRHDFFPILLELTQDTDESVSMRAEAILEFRKAEFAPSDGDDFFFRTLEHYLDPMGDIISEGTIRSLRSRTCSDRITALMRLLGASSSRLVKDELMALSDEERDPRVIATLVKALGSLGTLDALDRIMGFIGHPDARVRANVAEALSAFTSLAWVPGVVRKLMEDQNNRVIANCVVTLAPHDPGAACLGLSRLVDTMGNRGKASAIYAISNAGREELFSFLPPLASDADPDIAARANEAIRILFMEGHRISMPGSALVQARETRRADLLEVLVPENLKPLSRRRIQIQRLQFDVESPIVLARLKALGSIASSGETSCLPSIQIATRDSVMEVRLEAQRAYKTLKTRVASQDETRPAIEARTKLLERSWLVGQLQSPSRLERIKALKRIGPRDGHLLEVLVNHLEVEADPFVRPILSTIVGMLGDGLAIPRLIPLLRDSEPRVRANTVEALRYLNDDTVYGHFVTLLLDPNPRVRKNAETALAEYVSDTSGPRVATTLKAIANLICSEKDFSAFEEMVRSALGFLRENGEDPSEFMDSILKGVNDPVRVQRLHEIAGPGDFSFPDQDRVSLLVFEGGEGDEPLSESGDLGLDLDLGLDFDEEPVTDEPVRDFDRVLVPEPAPAVDSAVVPEPVPVPEPAPAAESAPAAEPEAVFEDMGTGSMPVKAVPFPPKGGTPDTGEDIPSVEEFDLFEGPFPGEGIHHGKTEPLADQAQSFDEPLEAPLSGSFVICTEDFSELELRRLVDRHARRLEDSGDLSWMASYQLSRIDDPRLSGMIRELAAAASGESRARLEKVLSTLRVLERARAGEAGLAVSLNSGGEGVNRPSEIKPLGVDSEVVTEDQVSRAAPPRRDSRKKSDHLAGLPSGDRQYVERILDKRIDKALREDAAAMLSSTGASETFEFLAGFRGEADSYARYLLRLVCEKASENLAASEAEGERWESLFKELSSFAEAGDPAFADRARAAFRTFNEKDRETLLSRLAEKFPEPVISLSVSMLEQDDSDSQLFALGFLSRIPQVLADEFEIINRIFDMYRFSPYEEIRFTCGRVLDGAGRKKELMETMLASRKSRSEPTDEKGKGKVKWMG